MSSKVSLPDPERFNLTSFSDILPKRAAIVGEDPSSFDAFHESLLRTFAPVTPYECVIAENLIAIEWELLQRRHIREAFIRRDAQQAIKNAVFKKLQQEYDEFIADSFDRHEEAGGTEDDWEVPAKFDRSAAEEAGLDVAARAASPDIDARMSACDEIVELGMDPVEVMGRAYTAWGNSHERHDKKVQELERRRREVKRDLDALQQARPVSGELIDV